MATRVLILAAGKQTRFKSELPKALAMVKGVPLLKQTIDRLKPYFGNHLYVVCSIENQHHFDGIGYTKLVIESGHGTGDAILKAMKLIRETEKVKNSDSIVIQWGDTLLSPQVYKTLIETQRPLNSVSIPCEWCEDPYVQWKTDESGDLIIKMKKLGDITEPGYHDLSIFMTNDKALYFALRAIEYKLDPRFGGEFDLFQVFTDKILKGNILNMKTFSFSFNTLEELEGIDEVIY